MQIWQNTLDHLQTAVKSVVAMCQIHKMPSILSEFLLKISAQSIQISKLPDMLRIYFF